MKAVHNLMTEYHLPIQHIIKITHYIVIERVMKYKAFATHDHIRTHIDWKCKLIESSTKLQEFMFSLSEISTKLQHKCCSLIVV